MVVQACIDESGDTGYSKMSSKYFVLCAIITDNPDSLRRLARDIHRKKYKKKKGNILHAYAESDELKNRLVRKLEELEHVSCVACVVKKQKFQNVDLYVYATKQLASYLQKQGVEVVVVAKRDTRKSYNEHVLNIYKDHGLNAIFSDPAKDKSLQIADFYSWSVYVYLERENQTFFNKIRRVLLID